MNRPFLSLLALLAMLGIASAQSALRWDKKTVEASLAPGEKTARADFAFTNISKAPVTIDSVKTSCGCTTATLEKKTYQPGEKGHITAVFASNGRQKGPQVKGIRVVVRGDPEPTVLTMVAQIGEAVQIDPPFVFWRVGDAPRPKTIRVKIPAGMGLRLARVSSNDPKIAAALETVKEGAEYQIAVTPQNTDRQAMAVLSLLAVNHANESKAFTAYAQVKGR